MRTFDLAPLYRSTVGFDRLFSMLDQVSGFESAAPSYPPYNIERTGENTYRITVAVAGFTEAELSIEVKEGALTIRGEKQPKDGENASQVLYQGIAARAFERRFQLADHVEVRGAEFPRNGRDTTRPGTIQEQKRRSRGPFPPARGPSKDGMSKCSL